MINTKQFRKVLYEDFPAVRRDIAAADMGGLLYLEMGQFARYVNGVIEDGDEDELVRCYALAERGSAEGSWPVWNAVGVSFLEHLNFQDGRARREWAFDLLPPHLRADAVSLGLRKGSRRP